MTRVSICFVCLGNICRSPTAEGVMRHQVDAAALADRIAIDSAGTGDCNDANADIHPSATEVCDDIDNDCIDGVDAGCDDDGDGY